MIHSNQTTVAQAVPVPFRLLGIPHTVWILAFAHGLVDCYATFVQPLWPTLAHMFQTEDGKMQWTFMAWSLAGSITQLGFAQLADAGLGRKLLWLGPLAGIVLIGIVGYLPGMAGLTLILVMSNLGFAAFHPEAATLAGSESPNDRARAMSIFAVGGYLGQALGPSLSGYLVNKGGLVHLVWTIPPGLFVCICLTLAWNYFRNSSPEKELDNTLVHQSHRHGTSNRHGTSIRAAVKGKKLQVIRLVVMSVTRVAAAMGVPLALAYGLDEKGLAADIIGEIQSVFLIGMGAGTLTCAVLVNKRNEVAVMWLAPLAVACLLPWAALIQVSHLWLLMAICGPLLGLSLPILTSRGQELLPDAPRVGSSLTMGVTWGLGGILVAALMSVVDATGNHFHAFYALSLFASISALMSWPGRAPRLIHDPSA